MIHNKSVLGKLFQRYLKQSKKTIVDIEHADISSVSTLYLSFKGNVIKNDQFYIDYCIFFNHEYKKDTLFDSWIEKFVQRMIHAFDFYEEVHFDNLYDEFTIKFNDYKEYAIYHEYYQVIQSLFNYYRNNEYLRLEEVEDYLDLIDIDVLPKELSLYLLDYMFRSNWNSIHKKELFEIIVHKMNDIDENHNVSMYQTGFLYKSNSQFIKALNLFQKCYEKTKLQYNRYKETQFLLAIHSIYRNTDHSLEEETAKILMEYKKNEKLPNTLIHNINYNIGMQDYLEGRYERAYELFNENLTQYHSYYTLLFQCSICSRLKYKYPEILFSKEIEDRYDFIYLDYFRQKHNHVGNVKLAKYILNTVIPKKLKDDANRNPYWSLFEYEIQDLAFKDKKIRKFYFEFMNEIGKYCKNN